MKPWLGGALLVAGLAAGYGLGSSRRADPEGDGADDPAALRRDRDALRVRADRAEAELASQRDAKRRPREGVDLPMGAVAADSRVPQDAPKAAPAKPAGPEPLTAEARTKRINEIRAAVHTWFENHEGEKALAALKELAALGPDARDDAMKLALDVNRDVNGAGTLRLPQFTFYTGLGDPAVRDLMAWSLENAASSPADFRTLSAWSLPWTMPPKDVIARFDAALANESDRGVQSAIVSNLGSMNTPEAESVLARIFGDPNRDAKLRADSVLALMTTKDEAVVRSIENAAQADPNAQVAAAARATLVARDPPATGLLVTGTVPDSAADAIGMKAGDIIVSYGGTATTDDEVLRKAIQTAGSAETVPVVIVREGREQTLTVHPGRLGVYGRPVTKK